MRLMMTNSLGLGLLLAACGGDMETGTLEVAIYGEDFAEMGIPAGEMSDDWEIGFDRFLVSVGGIEVVAGHDADGPAIEARDYRIYDVAQDSGGTGFAIASAEVPGGVYDHTSYRIAADADATAGNATADDVARMKDGGYAVYVEGSASRAGETVTFAWGFTTPTAYAHCNSTAEVDGGPARVELTIHVDHLFYDDAVAEEPALAFDLIASADAAGNADGDVSPAELAALDITGEERYQVGSADVSDLWSYLDLQVGTVGHIDGEGHCDDTFRQ